VRSAGLALRQSVLCQTGQILWRLGAGGVAILDFQISAVKEYSFWKCRCVLACLLVKEREETRNMNMDMIFFLLEAE